MEEKTAPVQRYPKRIPWEVHLKAYEGYSKEYGTSQSAERLAERGGFGIGEMDLYYPQWREHVEELPRLRAQLAEAIELRDQWAAACGEKNAELALLRGRLSEYHEQNDDQVDIRNDLEAELRDTKTELAGVEKENAILCDRLTVAEQEVEYYKSVSVQYRRQRDKYEAMGRSFIQTDRFIKTAIHALKEIAKYDDHLALVARSALEKMPAFLEDEA